MGGHSVRLNVGFSLIPFVKIRLSLTTIITFIKFVKIISLNK